jgi:hypothetical protein
MMKLSRNLIAIAPPLSLQEEFAGMADARFEQWKSLGPSSSVCFAGADG